MTWPYGSADTRVTQWYVRRTWRIRLTARDNQRHLCRSWSAAGLYGGGRTVWNLLLNGIFLEKIRKKRCLKWLWNLCLISQKRCRRCTGDGGRFFSGARGIDAHQLVKYRLIFHEWCEFTAAETNCVGLLCISDAEGTSMVVPYGLAVSVEFIKPPLTNFAWHLRRRQQVSTGRTRLALGDGRCSKDGKIEMSYRISLKSGLMHQICARNDCASVLDKHSLQRSRIEFSERHS